MYLSAKDQNRQRILQSSVSNRESGSKIDRNQERLQCLYGVLRTCICLLDVLATAAELPTSVMMSSTMELLSPATSVGDSSVLFNVGQPTNSRR